MPTYPYTCTSCNNEFEVEQRITAEPLVVCEACNQPTLKRLIANTSFTLRGGGWASDLYSKKSCNGDCKGCDK